MGHGRTKGGALEVVGPTPGTQAGWVSSMSEGLGEGHASVESGFIGAATSRQLSLHLSFLVCEMGLITEYNIEDCYEN